MKTLPTDFVRRVFNISIILRYENFLTSHISPRRGKAYDIVSAVIYTCGFVFQYCVVERKQYLAVRLHEFYHIGGLTRGFTFVCAVTNFRRAERTVGFMSADTVDKQFGHGIKRQLARLCYKHVASANEQICYIYRGENIFVAKRVNAVYVAIESLCGECGRGAVIVFEQRSRSKGGNFVQKPLPNVFMVAHIEEKRGFARLDLGQKRFDNTAEYLFLSARAADGQHVDIWDESPDDSGDDSDYDYGYDYDYRPGFFWRLTHTVPPFGWLIILGIPALIALIVCLCMKRSMKTAVSSGNANMYIRPDGVRLTRQNDIYTHTTVTRTQNVPDDDHNNSGGGGTTVNSGGFSSSHGKF